MNNIMYKLTNKQTGESHLCDKITIDRYDYYESDKLAKENDKFIYGKYKICTVSTDDGITMFDVDGYEHRSNFYKKVIATNNPSIDCPKVVDEVERLADEITPSRIGKEMFKEGYNKSQETHPFSEKDMIEFGEIIAWNMVGKTITQSFVKEISKELLQLWKEQKTKTVYYE